MRITFRSDIRFYPLRYSLSQRVYVKGPEFSTERRPYTLVCDVRVTAYVLCRAVGYISYCATVFFSCMQPVPLVFRTWGQNTKRPQLGTITTGWIHLGSILQLTSFCVKHDVKMCAKSFSGIISHNSLIYWFLCSFAFLNLLAEHIDIYVFSRRPFIMSLFFLIFLNNLCIQMYICFGDFRETEKKSFSVQSQLQRSIRLAKSKLSFINTQCLKIFLDRLHLLTKRILT